MTQQEAKEAMRNKIPVVTKRFKSTTLNSFTTSMNEFVGESGLITGIDVICKEVFVHGWRWPYESVELYEKPDWEKFTKEDMGDKLMHWDQQPNPALTEALEAIPFPLKYSERYKVFYCKDDMLILRFADYLKEMMPIEQIDALGHLIANNLNQLKRKG